jgi:hypothetical protein
MACQMRRLLDLHSPASNEIAMPCNITARYYAPSLGIFSSLDPWEGLFDQPMSLNGYD